MSTETKNYVAYHIHTDLSTGVTNVDSVTKFKDYVSRAKELGMKALAISEHGSCFEWFHKKEAIEAAGMKYIHAVEAYMTESYDSENKIRDNYHVILLAKNFEGFKEINKLISKSFLKEHFYYAPRMLLDDVINTSENIIITSACLGGVLWKGTTTAKEKFLNFAIQNKDRVFLEIQHHDVDDQKKYNQMLYELHKAYGLNLITGTDTHSLNGMHARGRLILQRATNTFFSDEEGWDLTFKSYDELVAAYEKQNALPADVYLQAIENTNLMAEMVEEFTLDMGHKYPKIYANSKQVFENKIREECEKNKYIQQRYTKEEINMFISEEIAVYDKTNAIDFMLLERHKKEWEIQNGIGRGYGRGSVSGSMIAYILGVTEMDSKKFGLNFFRFMNPDRVSLADVDTDYSEKDRDAIKTFILRDHMNLPKIQSCDIITFNTIALKGSIKYVCKALGYSLDIASALSGGVYLDENGKETVSDDVKKAYPDIFEYVDIVKGTVISIGTHASGVVVSDLNIDEVFGTCRVKDSEYPVSMINMKELDAQNFVKLDLLGLDNMGVINDTCKLLGIERLNPDNTPLDDENVWKSIKNDTTLIFQWESDSSSDYLKRFMSDETIQIAKKVNPDFSYIKWFSFGNGLIRPGCASFRDDVAAGHVVTTGFAELDKFLATTFGRVTMQEDIMQFLVKFCGYSQAESDSVRRLIAKKYGTESAIDEIHDRFINYSHTTYGESEEKLEEIFPPIKQGILDATRYAFSWNHSDAYSCVGYICGYLRYYYPLEFITAALNVFKAKLSKIGNIVEYAKKVGIDIRPCKFRYSVSDYKFDKETNSIYKGVYSVKSLNEQVANELYEMRNMRFNNFMDFLKQAKTMTTARFNQIEALIRLEYFEEFGEMHYLLCCLEVFKKYYKRTELKKAEVEELGLTKEFMLEIADKETAKKYSQINMVAFMDAMVQKQYMSRQTTVGELVANQINYMGYVDIADQKYKRLAFVEEIDARYSPKLSVYALSKGNRLKCKISKVQYYKQKIKEGDILAIKKCEPRNKQRKDENGDWVSTEEKEWWITEYAVVDNIERYTE